MDDIAAKTGVDKDTLSNIGRKFIKNSAYRDAPMLVMIVVTAIITFDFFAWTDVIDWGKNCRKNFDQSKSDLEIIKQIICNYFFIVYRKCLHDILL